MDRVREEWTLPFVSQIVFELPNQGYGSKRASGPPSKDSLAQQVGGKLFGWDFLLGTGTGHPTLNDDPDAEDITGQTFVHILGVDHLGGTVPPVIPPVQPPTDLGPILAKLDTLSREVAVLRATALTHGSQVSLRTDNGHYITALGGGGQNVTAERPEAGQPVVGYKPGGWETFTLEAKE
jgi:hypothetical protein